MPEVREFTEVLFPIGDNKYIRVQYPKDMNWDEWSRVSGYISQSLVKHPKQFQNPGEHGPKQPRPMPVLRGL